MGCYISIEPTIEIMAEDTIDKTGSAIRRWERNNRRGYLTLQMVLYLFVAFLIAGIVVLIGKI